MYRFQKSRAKIDIINERPRCRERMSKRVLRKVPSWLPLTSWFLAAIAGNGLWFFAPNQNWFGFVVSAFMTGALVLLSVLLHARHEAGSIQPSENYDAHHLLKLVWNYPLGGQEDQSWAVKESAVLRGEIAIARERPGLGVAIVTTELALLAFGPAAKSRIEIVATWASQQCEKTAPYRMTVQVIDEITYAVQESKPDLRHTLALAIVLLRANSDQTRSAEYVRLALQTQEKDGGWPAAGPTTSTAVFTTLYGIEVLSLAAKHPVIGTRYPRSLDCAHSLAFQWLIKNRQENGLWSTGVFDDEPWDCAVATAWILQRMIPAPAELRTKWKTCVNTATIEMMSLVESPSTWRGTTEAQRFRIEARVAAALRRVADSNFLSGVGRERVGRYLGSWTSRALGRLRDLPRAELDVSTAAFAIWGLVDENDLEALGKSILAEADIATQ